MNATLNSAAADCKVRRADGPDGALDFHSPAQHRTHPIVLQSALLSALLLLASFVRGASQSMSTVRFTATHYTASESQGLASITVERIGNLGETASVEYVTQDRTATYSNRFDGSDYFMQRSVLVFAPGQTNSAISVPIVDDGLLEGDETVLIRLLNPDPETTQVETPGSGLLILLDNDGGQRFPWRYRSSGTLTNLHGVTHGNGLFAVVGGGGTVVTSSNGVAWTRQVSGTDTSLVDVVYGEGVFVAIGGTDTVVTSSDGEKWTSRNVGNSSGALSAVAYGNGRFVAVGGGHAFASRDGAAWAISTTSSPAFGNSIAYGNETFVAVGPDGSVVTSQDGMEWTLGRGRVDGITTFYRVEYANGKFFAVGDCPCTCGQIPVPLCVVSSTDGVTWDSQSLGKTAWGFGGLAFGHSMIVAAGADEIPALLSPRSVPWTTTSTDGVLWEAYASGTPFGINRISPGNHTFVAVGMDGVIIQTDPIVTLKLQLGANVELVVFGPTGRAYRLEGAEELNSTNSWQTLATVSSLTSPFSWIDVASTNSSKRFYRAVLLP